MLEKLLSQTSVGEKKRILTEEYGMIMTAELEGRIQTMCNLSENIMEQSIKTERINAVERMLKASAIKGQIVSPRKWQLSIIIKETKKESWKMD